MLETPAISRFWGCLWFTAVLRTKYLAMI